MSEPSRRPRGIQRAQYLPLPIGEFRAVRRHRTTPLRVRVWRHRPGFAAAAGVALAIAAVLVTVTSPPAAVYLSGDAVHVDGITLGHPAGNGGLTTGRLYTGAATMVLRAGPDGTVVASAVTHEQGEEMRAVCTLDSSGATDLTERCQFRTGKTSFACDDVYNLSAPGAWQRRCSNGRVLSIQVPAGAEVIPMPFALGG